MIQKTKYGRPRCEGKKLNGFQCQEPQDTPAKYCHYCDALVKRLTTPWHSGFDPRKSTPNNFDWTDKPWSIK